MSDWVAAPLIIAAVIASAAVMTVMTRAFDQVRIREYVEQRGVNVVDIQRRMFGPGWFGSGSQRIYDVSYETSRGKVHTATCKTSMFAGVYWTGPAPGLMEGTDATVN